MSLPQQAQQPKLGIDNNEKQSLLAVLQFLKKKNLKVKVFYLLILYKHNTVIIAILIGCCSVFRY